MQHGVSSSSKGALDGQPSVQEERRHASLATRRPSGGLDCRQRLHLLGYGAFIDDVNSQIFEGVNTPRAHASVSAASSGASQTFTEAATKSVNWILLLFSILLLIAARLLYLKDKKRFGL